MPVTFPDCATRRKARFRGANRLLKLADHMAAAVQAKKYRFNMYAWVGHRSSQANEKECGTAGCAVGFCPVVFPRAFRYDFIKGGPTWQTINVRGRSKQMAGLSGPAVEQFFGINWPEYKLLFMPESYGYNPCHGARVPIRSSAVIKRLRWAAAAMKANPLGQLDLAAQYEIPSA